MHILTVLNNCSIHIVITQQVVFSYFNVALQTCELNLFYDYHLAKYTGRVSVFNPVEALLTKPCFILLYFVRQLDVNLIKCVHLCWVTMFLENLQGRMQILVLQKTKKKRRASEIHSSAYYMSVIELELLITKKIRQTFPLHHMVPLGPGQTYIQASKKWQDKNQNQKNFIDLHREIEWNSSLAIG